MKEKRKSKRKIIKYIILILLIILIIWTIWANKAVEVNTITISAKSLPESFDGYRIALVSDLHNAEFGNDNERLITLLEQADPDMIALTGDIIDSRSLDIEVALRFAEKAAQIAPCYFVSGNHEGRLDEADREAFVSELEARGVTILDDKEAIIERNGEKISLIGLTDTRINYNPVTAERLNALSSIDGYTILLCHRPDFLDAFADAEIDLALCGHVHGGQFRLPFIGGLLDPDRTFLPEHDAGLYTQGNCNMVVSRGLGNSVIPLRFNNRPEIVLIELKSERRLYD
ncbi:MAG: metallophosphoesterase [Clostridia bacterium]|nr:metallophosphoesterase [Clostridia bacterium]